MAASYTGCAETADLLPCSADVNQTNVSAFIHVRVSYREGEVMETWEQSAAKNHHIRSRAVISQNISEGHPQTPLERCVSCQFHCFKKDFPAPSPKIKNQPCM